MTSPYVFDTALADAAVEFFPRHLRLTTAEWSGRPFHLAEWQAHHTRQIFGWRRRSNGTRRYRKVRGWVPKKNGKSEWFAGIGHILTVGDDEPGAEVFSHATNKEQASIIWNKAKRMIELDRVQQGRLMVPGPFASLYESSATALFCPHLMSSFKPLSGDPQGKHGPNVHGALGDEAHEWDNGVLHRYLMEGMASRRQPLDCVFSSAGVIRTYGHELHEETLAIIADPSLDPETYCFSYQADKDADWTSPEVWAAANPNYPISPKHDFLVALCREAQRNPRLENEFKRYYCGIWTEQTTRWFAMHRWPALTRDPNDPKLWQKLAAEMRGRMAFGGLDLASNEDINSLVYVFLPKGKNKRYTLVCRFWCPQATIDKRDHPTRPYKRWVQQGALIPTPGEVSDQAYIEEQIKTDGELFRLTRDNEDEYSLAVDRWNATQIVVNLRNVGLPAVLMNQDYGTMTRPSKLLEFLFANGLLEHGNHPVLKWMFGNAAYSEWKGGIKPAKELAADKIDGVVSTVEGLALAIQGVKENMNLDDFLSNPVIMRS